MYAVIRSGGKQYKVAPGEVVRVEKLEQKLGDEVEFNQVLIVHDDKIGTIGKPLVEKAVVSGMVVELGRAKKVKVLKYCLLYTSPSPRDRTRSRMPSSA